MTLIELQEYMRIPQVYITLIKDFPNVENVIGLAKKGKIEEAKSRYDMYQSKRILFMHRYEIKRRKNRRVNARNLKMYGPYWSIKRKRWCIRLLKIQKDKCNMCGNPISLTTCDVDHIVRLGDGGPNKFENVQALCKKCHRIKDF